MDFCTDFFQKNPRVRKIRVRNSGAGNGCANFIDTWKNTSVLQEKAMPIKFLVFFGFGGGYFGFGGGGSADFIFMGAGIFLIFGVSQTTCCFGAFWGLRGG